jgi:hypothetical protein
MKFDVYGVVTGTKYIGQFEAATAEKALEAATARAGVNLCHRCSSECLDPEVSEMFAEEIEDAGQGEASEPTGEGGPVG